MRFEYQLPAGLIDAQAGVHKQVELLPLTGHEEELLANADYPVATLVTEVLSRCVKSIGSVVDVTPAVIRSLLVADRQYLLLMLRQLTFGDRIQATLPCPWPGCGKGVDVDFRISKIPITRCGDVRPVYEMRVEVFDGAAELGLDPTENTPLTVRYRLPNGADQESVLDVINRGEAVALSVLLSRCIQQFGSISKPDADWVTRLPASIRLLIEQEMEARAPSLDLTMEAECPECRRAFLAPFELQDFFFGELKIGTELLFREVHYLAFHYHWSEREIMDMPRNRRRRYIDVLSGEIEALNDQRD